ncbi:hypothetical protein VCHE48_2792 [Vibrio cholerae HE48]|nr:hypothetical protein VCHE48_2792 [Vibrio cholerae HE48]
MIFFVIYECYRYGTFPLALGTYYSKVSDTEDKDLGARLRIKYFF